MPRNRPGHPDSSRIAFASARADKSTLNLWWQRADGTGDAHRLTESKNSQMPGSWHPSGKLLAFEEQNAKTSSDVMILPLDGDEASGWKPGTPTVLLNSAAVEREPMFSPDGRWLAYVSDASGRGEVYVRPFPGTGAAVQISTGGGGTPTWSRKNDEIFYGSNAQIMVVPYALERNSFRAGKPRLWSRGSAIRRADQIACSICIRAPRAARIPRVACIATHSPSRESDRQDIRA